MLGLGKYGDYKNTGTTQHVGELIVRSSTNYQLIAGCFGHVGLRQLHTKRPAISCRLILLKNCSQAVRLIYSYLEERSKSLYNI